MTDNFNSDQVYKTLKLLLGILEKHKVKYWFMGSIIPSSLHKTLLRQVNDLDLLIVTDRLAVVVGDLKKLGYTQKVKNIYRVSEQLGMPTFLHPSLLEIGFFVLHKVGANYHIIAGPARVVIPGNRLVTSQYTFRGLTFQGLDPSIVYTLARLTGNNPKRKKELALYSNMNIPFATMPLYDFYFYGFKANWIIQIIQQVIILLGKVRTWVGKPYDLWR